MGTPTEELRKKNERAYKFRRSDMELRVPGDSMITRVVDSDTIYTLKHTGIDRGTGDVTLSLRETGVAAGVYNEVQIDRFGRVVAAWKRSYGGTVNAVLNQSASAQTASFWITGTGVVGTGLGLGRRTEAPQTTADTLYNIAGTLYWNGSVVGSGASLSGLTPYGVVVATSDTEVTSTDALLFTSGALRFKNNVAIDTQDELASFSLGYQAGLGSVDAAGTVFLGAQVGAASSATYSLFSGPGTGDQSTGSYIYAMGQAAAARMTSGSNVVALGSGAGADTSSFSNTVALGTNAGNSSSSISNSVLAGYGAGSTGSYTISDSVAAGIFALANEAHDISSSISIGSFSGSSANSWSWSAAVGANAGLRSVVISSSLMFGYNAGQYTENLHSCVSIGRDAGQYMKNQRDNICIGESAGAYMGYNTEGSIIAPTGSNNICIGVGAGAGGSSSYLVGSNNILIGYWSGNASGYSGAYEVSNQVIIDPLDHHGVNESSTAFIYGLAHIDAAQATLSLNSKVTARYGLVVTAGDVQVPIDGVVLAAGAGTAPVATANRLYNVDGVLYWNGTALLSTAGTILNSTVHTEIQWNAPQNAEMRISGVVQGGAFAVCSPTTSDAVEYTWQHQNGWFYAMLEASNDFVLGPYQDVGGAPVRHPALRVKVNAFQPYRTDFYTPITLASATPADTTNALYNVDGVLYWNGSAIGSGGGYTLPIASATVLGGIKVGTGLTIDGSGVLSATGGSTPSNMVTTDTTQTVTGAKTFDSIWLSNGAPAAKTSALYNISGQLWWSDAAVGTAIIARTFAAISSPLAADQLDISWQHSYGAWVGRLLTNHDFVLGALASGNTVVPALTFKNTGYAPYRADFSVPLTIASSTPADTTNALYNVSGTLYWNGSAVGSGGGATALDALTDVTLTSNTQYDTLMYTGSVWANAPLATHTILNANSHPELVWPAYQGASIKITGGISCGSHITVAATTAIALPISFEHDGGRTYMRMTTAHDLELGAYNADGSVISPALVIKSTGAAPYRIDFTVPLTIASVTPASTTNALYNVGGSLYWNGVAVAAGTPSNMVTTDTTQTVTGAKNFSVAGALTAYDVTVSTGDIYVDYTDAGSNVHAYGFNFRFNNIYRTIFRWNEQYDRFELLTREDNGSNRASRLIVPRASASPTVFDASGGVQISQGGLYLVNNTPGTTTSRLYNIGGTLYWNGGVLVPDRPAIDNSTPSSSVSMTSAWVNRHSRIAPTVAVNIVVEPGIAVVGDQLWLLQANTTFFTLTAGSGVTLNCATSQATISPRARYSEIRLLCVAANTYDVSGDFLP